MLSEADVVDRDARWLMVLSPLGMRVIRHANPRRTPAKSKRRRAKLDVSSVQAMFLQAASLPEKQRWVPAATDEGTYSRSENIAA